MSTLTLTRYDQLLLERLVRYLRVMVGLRNYPVHYTGRQTSYYDGKALYVIKKVDREPHLFFNDVEKEMIQKAHAIHEAGHHFFDYLPAYTDWLKNNSLQAGEAFKDYEKHKHIPRSYLQMFGNNALDGRMERLLCLRFPNTEVPTLLEYCNEEWAFHRVFNDAERGKKKLKDFREMFSRRINGMVEFPDEWLPEVQDLMNAHQSLIDKFLVATSTANCLTGVSEWIDAVWPTLLEWFEEENEAPATDQAAYSDDMFSEDTQWNEDSEMAETLVTQLLIQAGNNPPIKPPTEDIKAKIKAELSNVEEKLQAEENDKKGVSMAVSTQFEGNATIGEITLKTPQDEDIAVYTQAAQQSIRNVSKLSAVLTEILAEVGDSTIRGTNRGRLMMNRVWQGVYCDNPNIRQHQKKGKPGEKAIIEFMADISGSTYGNVLRTIQESLSFFLLAADRSRIPTKAFAFNSNSTETMIYKVKPDPHVFDERVKGRIGGLRSARANRDVSALQFLFDDILEESGDIKIAVMISDGAPNFVGKESPAMMIHMIEQIEQQNVHVLCLFVGDDLAGLEIARQIYGKRVIHAKDRLVEAMRSSITKILNDARR